MVDNEGPATVVHVLREGRAYCDISGVPGVWPKGHAWIAFNDPDLTQANCPRCLEVRDVAAKLDAVNARTPAELERMLKEMHAASDAFYWRAFSIGCHPFIEFCGLMNEYIKMCANARDAGIDFAEASAHSGRALPMQEFEAAYLGEKLGCIYGPSLQDPANRRAFMRAAGLNDSAPKKLCPRHWEHEAGACPECNP
jgi:hypothetical protein